MMPPGKITLYSPLKPRAIAQRMLDLIGEGEDAESAEGFIGNGDETQMTLNRAKGARNIAFAATLDAQGTGTRLSGRFSDGAMKWRDLWLFAAIFGGVGLIFVVIGIAGLLTGMPYMFGTIFIVVPVAMWTIAAVILSRFLRRDPPETADEILAFLHRHLQTEVISRED